MNVGRFDLVAHSDLFWFVATGSRLPYQSLRCGLTYSVTNTRSLQLCIIASLLLPCILTRFHGVQVRNIGHGGMLIVIVSFLSISGGRVLMFLL